MCTYPDSRGSKLGIQGLIKNKGERLGLIGQDVGVDLGGVKRSWEQNVQNTLHEVLKALIKSLLLGGGGTHF